MNFIGNIKFTFNKGVQVLLGLWFGNVNSG